MKKIIIRKGQVIDYQTMIEEIVGPFMCGPMNYDNNNDNKKIIAGVDVGADHYRAFFIGDADYEITITKKRNSRY